MEAHDVLADHVQIRGPVAAKLGAIYVGVTDRGDVVGERVDPHIHDVLRIARDLHAPVEGRTRDRQVLQAALDEGADLVEPLLRQHEVGMALIEIEQLLLVSGKPEEIALLFDPFDRRALRPNAFASPIEPSLVLVVICFISNRVPARILVEVNVARRFHSLPNAD